MVQKRIKVETKYDNCDTIEKEDCLEIYHSSLLFLSISFRISPRLLLKNQNTEHKLYLNILSIFLNFEDNFARFCVKSFLIKRVGGNGRRFEYIICWKYLLHYYYL